MRRAMSTILASCNDNLQLLLDNLKPLDTLVLPQGGFRQKLEVNVADVTIVGAGADKTAIVYGDYAKMLDGDGQEITTFKTQTLAICADGVTLKNLTVSNDAESPEVRGQEVALYVTGDRFTAVDCVFTSTQDTLFCAPLPDDLVLRYDGFLKDSLRFREGQCRQIFKNCVISGTVDFIFGCATAFFDHCRIASRYDARNVGYVAAPAHSLKQTLGFVFYRCSFVAENNVANNSIYLARPWRDFGLCHFVECVYGKHLSDCGFDKWNNTERDKTARFYEYPAVASRVAWRKTLTQTQLEQLLQTCKKTFDY